jgi:dienelactone hydrolase
MPPLGLWLALVGLAACAPVAPVASLGDGRTGTIHFSSISPSSVEFARGQAPADTVVISGELSLPRGRSGPVPAVVLIHGSSGVGRNMPVWVGELTSIGVAAFVVDSFGGRGIRETATDQSRLSSGAMIVDAYRALAVLATHPAIDRERIAVMGFSKGGFVALYSSLDRFQRLWGPSDLRFAAHLPFYPSCNIQLYEDEKVSARPIRIFHGEADNWTPIEPCRRYAERLRQAGADVEVIGFPGAHHGFDAPGASSAFILPSVQNGSGCDLVERTPGVAVHRASGAPATRGDPCLRLGATVGSEPRAQGAAVAAVKAFLTATFGLARR